MKYGLLFVCVTGAFLSGCMTPKNGGIVTSEMKASPPAWITKPGQLPDMRASATDKSQSHVADIYRFCYPDCYADTFDLNHPNYVNFTVGGCHYQVEYFTRHACNTWCDVYISRVFSLDPPPCGSGTMSPGALLDAAEAAAIRDAALGPLAYCRPDSIGQCTVNWRVTKGACWSWIPGWPPEVYQILANCDGTACCLCSYRVCRNLDGSLSVTKLFCSGSSPILCPPDCTPVCE